MTDLGLTRISPFTLGKTIHRHIVSPLRQRARLRIFAAEKQVITLKKNLDYETYIISNRSGNRDDNIRERPETYKHSG